MSLRPSYGVRTGHWDVVLGEGIGAVDLDEIFSRFCVGK